MYDINDMCDLLDEKRSYYKKMNESLSNYITNTNSKINKAHYIKAKDYVYYYGNAWGDDGDPFGTYTGDEKFKDRLRPVFKHFYDAIIILHEFGLEDMVKPYLESLKNKGLDISFSLNNNANFNIDSDASDSIITQMAGYQSSICNVADDLRDQTKEMVNDTNMSKSRAQFVLGKINKLRKGLSDKDREAISNQIVESTVDKNILQDIGSDKVPDILNNTRGE